MTEETADWLADSVRIGPWTASDFKIYAATGTLDTAYYALKNQIGAMLDHSDVFTSGEAAEICGQDHSSAPSDDTTGRSNKHNARNSNDPEICKNFTDSENGNLFSFFAKGGVHDYVYAYEYLCSALRAALR